MSLLFAESFDHYTSILQKWDAQGGASAGTRQATGGRVGSAGWQFGGDLTGIIKNLGGQYSTLYTGMAVKVTTGGDNIFCSWRDAGTDQVQIRILSDGTIRVLRGDGTILGTSTYQIPTGIFVFLEMKLVVANGTGEVTIRVDGTEVYSLTGQDTANTSNTYATQFRFGQTGGTGTGASTSFIVDDIYICDSAGSTNNSYLGDIHIEVIRPNGAGSNAAWSPDGSAPEATNWESVDEEDPDDETTYVTTSTPGDLDSYAFGDLVATDGNVLACVVYNRIRKELGGGRTFAAFAKVSTNETVGPTKAMSTEYYSWPTILETKPGGGAWTITDVNAAEFGQKVIA